MRLSSLLLVGLLASPAIAELPRAGAPATPVVIEDLFGKPVAVPTGRRAVLFYEDEKSGALNLRAHKKVAEIVDRHHGNPGFDVMIVADAQSFNYWPARGFALKELRKIEKVEKAPVFADWTGGIVRGWKLTRGKCSLTVIGPDGIVQFHVDGPLTERQLTELEHVLVPEVATR
jgi:hypothetical protein